MKEQEYDERLTLRLSGRDRLKLSKWAEAMGMSVGEVLRALIEKWFEHEVSIARPSRDDRGLK